MENKNSVIAGLPGTSSLKPFNPPTSKVNVGNIERMVSVAGSAGLTWLSLRNKDPKFFPLLVPAAYLLFRGVSGYCFIKKAFNRNPVYKKEKDLSISILQKVTINKPVSEVYGFWKNMENLPRVMNHISDVMLVEGRTYRWKMSTPVTNTEFTWDAVMIEDILNEKISWRSLEGSEIMNAGEIRFRMINSIRTEIQVTFNYAPPVGYVGKTFAGWFKPLFERMIRSDIKRVKNFLEKEESRETGKIVQKETSGV